MQITLSECKRHLNIEPSFHEDDEYILTLAQAAEDIFERHTDRKISEIITGGNIPASARHCLLLLVAQLYANREGTCFASVSEMPFSIQYLIALNRKYSVG